MEGTKYILRIHDACLTQHGFLATVYETIGKIIYPYASIQAGQNGELNARRCADVDHIPKDLKKLLREAGLKVKDSLT